MLLPVTEMHEELTELWGRLTWMGRLTMFPLAVCFYLVAFVIFNPIEWVMDNANGWFFKQTEATDNTEGDESSWHCPYCQTSWGYVGSTEKQRLKNEIASLKRQKQWAEDTAAFHQKDAAKKENQRRAQKGANTRLKKRIACGSCPCCKRNFKDLRRHMQSQHPDFDQAEA